MEDKIKQPRILAFERFENGESPESICTSLGKSKRLAVQIAQAILRMGASWCEECSHCLLSTPMHTPKEIKEIVQMIHLNLYNRDMFCGAQDIRIT